MVDLVHFKQEGFDDIMPDELELRVLEVPQNVLLAAREEIVHNDDTITALDEAIHEMATDESGPACNQNTKGFPLQPKGYFGPRLQPMPYEVARHIAMDLRMHQRRRIPSVV